VRESTNSGQRVNFIPDHHINFLRRWTVLRISRPTLLNKWPILFKELRIMSSGGPFRSRYVRDDHVVMPDVMIKDFVGEDLEAELMTSSS
jgi:hypothetical protein